MSNNSSLNTNNKYLQEPPRVTLNNNVTIPMLGFGTYKLTGTDCELATLQALELGYRYIDTASLYMNEVEIRKAIQQSGIPRSELTLQSKLWIHGAENEDTTLSHFYRSLEALGTDYLDIFLIHQPYNNIYAAWRMMEKLYNQGLIKAIGLSNFSRVQEEDLITFNKVAPVINQIQYSPLYPRQNLLSFHQHHNILLQAWAPLAQGEEAVLNNPILKLIAEAKGITTSQVIIRWLLDQGVSVVVKSKSFKRIQENFQIPQQSFSPELIEAINLLEFGIPKGVRGLSHKDPLFVERVNSRNHEMEEYYQHNKITLESAEKLRTILFNERN